MTGSLLPAVVFRATDAADQPVSGAKLFAYLSGTLTPTPVYTSAALSNPVNPVTADSTGTFPEIFLDPTVTYRFQIKTPGGVLLPGGDIDPYFAGPVNAAGSITAAMLAAGAASGNLGFTPLNKAGDTATGELIIGYTMGAAPSPTSVGFRGMPQSIHNAAYQFAADDSGRYHRHTSGSAHAWTIPLDATLAFPIGTTFPFRNSGAGVVTMTRAVGLALTISGSGTSKDVAVAQYGAGAIIKDDVNIWYISGTNLS